MSYYYSDMVRLTHQEMIVIENINFFFLHLGIEPAPPAVGVWHHNH